MQGLKGCMDMKKLLFALLAAGSLATTHATVIEWSASNDLGGGFLDYGWHDNVYTGLVTDVAYNNGSLSVFDALELKYAVIDLNADKFYLSTTNRPALGGALLTASFGFDVNTSNFQTAAGYTLSDISINNTIHSQALTEFAADVAVDPAATYKFSFINPVGNGQLASVPEPTTIGLMGMGILGLAFGLRRRKH